MKLFRNYLCMAALVLSACIVTACDDDDVDEVTTATSTGVAVDVAGTRYGYTTVTSAYLSTPYFYFSEHIHITYVDATTVKVVYNNDTWGDYTVDQATITTNSDGTYTLSGSGSATITIPGSTESSTYDCTLSGTVDSDLTATIVFTMAVMGTTTVTVTEGTADSGVASAYLETVDYSSGAAIVNNNIFQDYADSGTLTVEANSDGETINVTYASDTWGTYDLEGLTVSNNGAGYFTISGSGTVDITYGSYSFTDQPYTLEATISEDATDYTFTYTVEIDVLGTTTIVYTYTTEEEEEEEEDLGDETEGSALAGTYTGTLDVSLSDTYYYGPYDDQQIIITANDDGTINIIYDAYDNYTSGSGYDWGDYELTSVTVYESDGVYQFSTSGTSTIYYGSFTPSGYEIECTFAGTITDTSDFEFTITYNIMGMFDATMTIVP